MREAQITFCGGAGAVTGANFLLEFNDGQKTWRVLIDCGLYQGPKVFEDKNLEPFAYDPAQIDALFVTHAHLDHIGRIPKLVAEGLSAGQAGFRGPIYSTAPTKEIAELSLLDSLGVMEKESRRTGAKPLYRAPDVAAAMARWQTVEYREPVPLGGQVKVILRDAGHILGSAMIEFNFQTKKLLFTGDLGNTPAPFLRDTERVTDADYLVMESVYGDREHKGRDERVHELEDIIERTAKDGGTLMVPAFSIERTQELLHEIETMVENKKIPPLPVYLDSPLAIHVTAIYKKYKNYLNNEVLTDPELFQFSNLHRMLTTEESKSINQLPPPKIIIAGSGMSNGGRIIHHEKHYLPDPKSTLMLVGYQSAGSLGRILQEGAREVKILGEWVPVRARVTTITGYSAHKDTIGLTEFAAASADRLKKVMLAMGEPAASMFLAQRLRDYYGLNAVVPQAGETVRLEL